MDQNQAYGTIQTPQPLDAVQELVSIRYNHHHKLVRRSFLHSELYHVPSGHNLTSNNTPYLALVYEANR